MRRTFAIGLAVAMLASAAAAADSPLQVSYAADASMDCDGITAESVRMDQVIGQANAQVSGADGSARGAGLASTVAVEGLARSGMLARMPGVGMFANQAANTIQTANTRKALLTGLYAGKSCDAPPAAPAAAPVAAGAPGGF